MVRLKMKLLERIGQILELHTKRKRGNRRVPLPFRGKQAERCSHNVGKLLGEGLAHKIL